MNNTVSLDGTLDHFILPKFEEIKFTSTDVHFEQVYEESDDDGGYYWYQETTVSYHGTFEMVRGIISGTFTSISYWEDGYGGFDRYELEVSEGIYVADLAAMQKSGQQAFERLLLAGDDDIWNYIENGYAGNDTFHSPGKANGGTGFDTVSFDVATKAIKLDLIKHADDYTSIERFIGGNYNDQMRGSDAGDLFYGGRGADLLIGRWGNDKLFGGLGNDRFIGGPGRDTLTGNGGRDTFIFEKVSESTRGAHDLITDFDRANDLIDLDKIDAVVGRGGDQDFKFIGNHAFTGHAGELRFYVSSGLTHVVADTDGNKTIDFDVALKGSYKLTAADFDL